MKALVLIGAIVALAMSREHFRRLGIDRFEYPLLILLAAIGMMVMISANDLIALYLGLELQSLAAYVIAVLPSRQCRARREAGLKYCRAGCARLRHAALPAPRWSTVSPERFPSPRSRPVVAEGPNPGVIFGSRLHRRRHCLQGLSRAVPYVDAGCLSGRADAGHRLLRLGAKVAAMALAVRVFIGAFPTIVDQWQQIIVFSLAVTLDVPSAPSPRSGSATSSA